MKTVAQISMLSTLLAMLSFCVFDAKPAIAFIKSMDSDQKAKAVLPFDDPSKSNWHFIPGNMWPRAGITLADLEGNQKNLFHNLLQTSLSEVGYNKAIKIMDLENVLREISKDSVMRNPENYFIAFYGNPEKDSLWAWSFEGHHVSLNFTNLNGRTSIAPRFLGANPAKITTGPRKGERALDREEDLGLELVNSLSEDQKQTAIFQKKAFFGITTGNSMEVGPLRPVGIEFNDLSLDQQMTLLNLIDVYLSAMPEETALRRMENLKKEEIDGVRFGWAGATKPGEGHYYRIQGKSFLVEFDNTQGNANHIHTVWRDFDGDFGRDLIKEHYMNSNHH